MTDTAEQIANIIAASERIAAEGRRVLAAINPPPEPRPATMYVDEVPVDGSVEIRWQRSNAAGGWSGWNRITGEQVSILGQGWRCLVGPNVNFHRDHVVQVRPVMDPQTGDMLAPLSKRLYDGDDF